MYRSKEKSVSLWSMLDKKKCIYANPAYDKANGKIIIADYHIRSMKIWEEQYLKYVNRSFKSIA